MLASYNIKHGLGMDGALDLARIGDVLAELDADVVLLQEVDECCGRSGGVDQAAWLGARLGMEWRFAPFMDYDGGRYGLATLSRLPVTRSDVIVLPPGTQEPRSALRITVDLGGGEHASVTNAHLDWMADPSRRLAQARVLRAELDADERARPTAVAVLGGDLNDVPSSDAIRVFTAAAPGAEPAFARLGPTEPTFPADAPKKTIDHFLARGGGRWTPSSVTVVDERLASDHRPVVAE